MKEKNSSHVDPAYYHMQKLDESDYKMILFWSGSFQARIFQKEGTGRAVVSQGYHWITVLCAEELNDDEDMLDLKSHLPLPLLPRSHL
jgi:hypothetical protein